MVCHTRGIANGVLFIALPNFFQLLIGGGHEQISQNRMQHRFLQCFARPLRELVYNLGSNFLSGQHRKTMLHSICCCI